MIYVGDAQLKDDITIIVLKRVKKSDKLYDAQAKASEKTQSQNNAEEPEELEEIEELEELEEI